VADQDKDPRVSRRAERRARTQADPGQREKPATTPERAAGDEDDRRSDRRQTARDRNQRVRERALAERSRRRAPPEEEVVRGLDAGEMVDDALTRALHSSLGLLRKHGTVVQWGLVLAVVGFIGWRVVVWHNLRNLQAASDQLMQGVHAEQGTVGELPPIVQPKEMDTRQQFSSEGDRLKRAEELYRAAASGKPNRATSWLAKLGLAGVLYDQKRWDEALGVYREVKGSELAKQDGEVRVRAVEGIGLCLEAKGDQDGALAAFHELENSDVRDYAALGLYQQARLRLAKGERDQAKQLLAKLAEKTKRAENPGNPQQREPGFVVRAAEELELAMDPASVQNRPGLSSEAMGEGQMSALQLEQIRKLLENMQKQKGRQPLQLPSGSPAPAAPKPSTAP
jgi:predicted negative regulator of RcsB-dependent stress response